MPDVLGFVCDHLIGRRDGVSMSPREQATALVAEAAVLMIEGIGGAGAPPGRGLARGLAVAFPDGSTKSWQVAPESRWKRSPDGRSAEDAGHVLYPAQVAGEISNAAAGHRVIARDVKDTRRYLGRLFAAAGLPLGLVVEEYDRVALSLHVGSVAFATLTDVLMDAWFRQDIAAAAQTAAGLLQAAARKLEYQAEEERREVTTRDRGPLDDSP